MADKVKMTQVEAMEIAVEVLDELGIDERATEARDILKGMVEKRKAANSNRKPRVNKEAVAFRERIVEVLANADAPMTNADLATVLEVKPQKIANNVRILEKDGVVLRTRGEKASDKDTFTLA